MVDRGGWLELRLKASAGSKGCIPGRKRTFGDGFRRSVHSLIVSNGAEIRVSQRTLTIVCSAAAELMCAAPLYKRGLYLLMIRAAVITVSDSCFLGQRVDVSGRVVADLLQAHDFQVVILLSGVSSSFQRSLSFRLTGQ